MESRGCDSQRGMNMDVDRALRDTDTRLMLDLMCAEIPAAANAPILAPPGPGNPTLLTAAFSYFLRFELARRHPDAITAPWLAERAAEFLADSDPELATTAARLVTDARESFDFFKRHASPGPDMRASLAAHALRMGRLDATARAGYIDARMGDADDADIADLLAMYEHVPWDTFANAKRLELAPEFADDPSGNASADLQIDGRLMLVRTGKTARPDAADTRRLITLLALARAKPDAPEVRELATYHARHGTIWTTPAEPIIAHAAFTKLSELLAREATRSANEPVAPGRKKQPGWVRSRRAKPSGIPRDVGKARVKKSKDPREAPPPPAEPRRARTDTGEPQTTEKKGPSRPDWRRNSTWRRERGL